MHGKYRISQLSELAGRAFDELHIGQNSGRVRQVPDVRTIRYYTTLGLLDRPSEMKGRTAYYQNRHLIQLIAIKRLQSKGNSLVEVQQHMTAIDEQRLNELAAVPSAFFRKVKQWLSEGDASVATRSAATRDVPVNSKSDRRKLSKQRGGTGSEDTFWARSPVLPVDAPAAAARIDVQASTVLRLADNVSLHLDGVSADRLGDDTVSLLQPVLQELTSLLQSAGLASASITGDQNDT